MMSLRQRRPREEDQSYLAYVRTLPCMICQRIGPNDPAHLRSAAPQYGKPPTGMGEKPDDKWTLPLCRTHHDDQHRGNELHWWARHGYADPFAVAIALYAARPNPRRPVRHRLNHDKPTKPRKPKAERAPIQSRGFEKGHRPLRSRNNLRKATT